MSVISNPSTSWQPPVSYTHLHGFILYGQKELGDSVYGFDADSVYTGQWMVDGDTVRLFWDDGTEDTAVLIPNEHPGDVGEDVSTLSLLSLIHIWWKAFCAPVRGGFLPYT